MRDINIFDTEMFPYLEGEEIKGTTLTLTIRDIRAEKMKSHKGQVETKEVLYFTETHKGFVLNKTNAKRIAQMYGSATGQWAGKQITLTTEPVQAFGELHNALRVVLGAVGNGTAELSLENIFNKLCKITRIKTFYQTPQDIMRCRKTGSVVPPIDDIEGWRQLFIDARDYALEEVTRAADEEEVTPDEIDPEIVEAETEIELIEDYPEIFGNGNEIEDEPF